MDTWYNIQNNEVDIFGEIGGFGINAESFISEIESLDTDEVKIKIASLGGSASEALAIHNYLKTSPKKSKALYTGISASAATIIGSGADEVEALDNILLLIHNGHTLTVGNAEDHRKTADMLDKFDNSISSVYRKRTGKRDSTVKSKMSEEVWMSADEAKEWGLIDKVVKADKVQNSIEVFNSIKKYELPEIPVSKLNILNSSDMDEQTIIDKVVNGVKDLLGKKQASAEEILNAVTPEIEKIKNELQTDVENSKQLAADKEKELNDYKASVKAVFETDKVEDIKNAHELNIDKISKYEGTETKTDPKGEASIDNEGEKSPFDQMADRVRNLLPKTAQ